MKLESFWKSRLLEIEEAMLTVRKGKVSVLTSSAGQRDIYMVEYGVKEDFGRRANYNSACGAKDPTHYANKPEDSKPVLLIIGGIHGGELEGIVAVMNLIQLLETGEDYRGKRHDYLFENAHRFRLLLIPCMNPDGRARLPVDTLINVSFDKTVYYMQGTWKDGSLCKWPDCKAVHPIKEASDFLGSYFNDDGVNIMHDNFFVPMARETSSLLGVVDREAPDFTVLLHGGSNYENHLLPTSYVPLGIMQRQQAFNEQIAGAFLKQNLPYSKLNLILTDEGTYPYRAFNLTSAIHHVCGGISFTFESNMGLDAPGIKLTEDEILDSHFVLFEEMFRYTSI